MKEVSHQFSIDQHPDTSWTLLRDLTQAPNYVPGVVDVTIDTEATEGIGASRTVHLNRKPGRMQETVEEWEDGTGFLLRLHLGDKPIAPIFTENFFRYAMKADGGKTHMTLSMLYEPAGIFGALLGKLVVERAFRKELVAIGGNLKKLYEGA